MHLTCCGRASWLVETPDISRGKRIRQRRRSVRKAGITLLSILVLSAGLSACLVSRPASRGSATTSSRQETTEGSGRTQSTSSIHRPNSARSAQLDQFAINEATQYGDPKVTTVTWVSTTWSQINSALSQTVNSDASGDVYVLEMQGSFTVPVSSLSPAPTCAVLISVLSPSTMTRLAGECLTSSIPPDLTQLGTPQKDTLSGLTATPTTVPNFTNPSS